MPTAIFGCPTDPSAPSNRRVTITMLFDDATAGGLARGGDGPARPARLRGAIVHGRIDDRR